MPVGRRRGFTRPRARDRTCHLTFARPCGICDVVLVWAGEAMPGGACQRGEGLHLTHDHMPLPRPVENGLRLPLAEFVLDSS